MSLAYHQVAKNRCSRVTAQTHDVNDVNNPFHAVRLAIENLSDDQVRGLIRALVHGLVQGMIAEVAARTDDIVDDAVQSISNQIATAAEHLQQVSASAAEVKSSRCQDGVQRTCELCGRVGSRRFLQSDTGWRCAPSATKCVGHRRQPSVVDAGHVVEGESTDSVGPSRVQAAADRPLKAVRTPGVTARCLDCRRTWALTDEVLQLAIKRHELRTGHIVDVYDDAAGEDAAVELAEACP